MQYIIQDRFISVRSNVFVLNDLSNVFRLVSKI